jgi:hypothetical protein
MNGNNAKQIAHAPDHRAETALLAARYRVPAVYSFRLFAEVGGLLSDGANPLGEFRRAASYADRILRGGWRRLFNEARLRCAAPYSPPFLSAPKAVAGVARQSRQARRQRPAQPLCLRASVPSHRV